MAIWPVDRSNVALLRCSEAKSVVPVQDVPQQNTLVQDIGIKLKQQKHTNLLIEYFELRLCPHCLLMTKQYQFVLTKAKIKYMLVSDYLAKKKIG